MSKYEQQHVEVIWGDPILDEGFTAIPNIIIRNYSKLGLTHGEYALLTIMFSFKHDANDPYPSQETIAKHLYGDDYKPESSLRALRKLLKSIEDKGLLEVSYRYKDGKRVSNQYSFAPLIEACLKFIKPKVQNSSAAEIKVAKKRTNTGVKLQEQKVPVVQEQKVPVGTGTKSSGRRERKVPMKKKREKEKIKKKIEKESIYLEEVKKLDIPTKLVSFLENKIDRLILLQIDLLDIELLFQAYREKMGHMEFMNVLDDVLKVDEYTHSFKAYFRKALDTNLVYLANHSKGKFADSSKSSGRKEKIPDWMDDEKKEPFVQSPEVAEEAARLKAEIDAERAEKKADYLERVRKLKEKGVGVSSK